MLTASIPTSAGTRSTSHPAPPAVRNGASSAYAGRPPSAVTASVQQDGCARDRAAIKPLGEHLSGDSQPGRRPPLRCHRGVDRAGQVDQYDRQISDRRQRDRSEVPAVGEPVVRAVQIGAGVAHQADPVDLELRAGGLAVLLAAAERLPRWSRQPRVRQLARQDGVAEIDQHAAQLGHAGLLGGRD